MSRWPPLPPEPPEPPQPPRTPWLPDPRLPAPGPVSATASLVVGSAAWLDARLLDQRMVALAGELDPGAVNQAVAELALLDATSEDPVRLRLSGVSADLGGVLTLVDAIDLMSAPVHATALGTLTGPAVVVLAVADRRTAGGHALFQLTEPSSPRHVGGRDVGAWAAEHGRQVRRLQERLAEACHRPVDEIVADMRAGKLLGAEEAREYGLVDDVGAGPRTTAGS
jgi:ATP-dependent Clp protease, protease subunit